MSRRTGLTLLDLLVAMAILAVILTSIYWVFANHQRSVEAASESRDAYGQGRIILDRMVRDLAGAWLPAGNRLKTGFSYIFDGQKDRLNLITTARLSPDIAPGLDLVEVGYRTVENEDGEELTLLRRQDRTPDGEALEGGTEIFLTRSLRHFEISYINRLGEELSTWQAKDAGGLPRAVRINLTLSVAPDKKETFTTVVALALSWPKVKIIELPAGLEGFF
ncbi:MAG: prepilin-type N-terminal cleavage/methylation domain-containing protein [Deltaproteobacteria bacterium]|nr:prepilin-type N-terminal cleavage/methylation domain-containing protein [Deltaproteobacteria bacterium]MBW2086864.1 prepilin-type N-terminal cleavage/methylation domain-containing protein [Deltaproteobacteria bacterium]